MKNKTNLLFLFIVSVVLLTTCERTVTVPPPDEPPPKGYLFLDSKPKGMHIFLNGKERRRLTPDSLTWLENGEYLLTFKHPLFLDTSLTVNINEVKRESLYVDYTLNPAMMGKIYIGSYPSGAEIFINDSLIGKKSPVLIDSLMPGLYKVQYKLKDHRDIINEVLVTSSKTDTSFVSLLDTTIWTDYNFFNSDLVSDNLSCIKKDNYGRLWIGSSDNGLYSFINERFRNYHKFNSAISSNEIYEIEIMEDNTMLIAAAGAFMLAKEEVEFGANNNNEWDHWTMNDENIPLPGPIIKTVGVENLYNLWIGTTEGLMKAEFIEDLGLWIYEVYNTENSMLSDNVIEDISCIENSIWIGGRNSGLILINNGVWDNIGGLSVGQRVEILNCIYPVSGVSTYVGFEMNSDYTPGLAYYSGGVWQNDFFDMPDNNVFSFFIDSQNRKWIGTETSIIVYTNWNDRKIFTAYNSGLPITKITGFEEDEYGNIIITSFGGGLFKYKK